MGFFMFFNICVYFFLGIEYFIKFFDLLCFVEDGSKFYFSVLRVEVKVGKDKVLIIG